jgi:ribosomal protein L7/L12
MRHAGAVRKAKDEAERKAREAEERSAREEVPFVRKYRDGVYRGEQIVEGNVGHGVWEGTDGSRYKGEFLFGNGFFLPGEYHGHGVLVLPSGDRYDGDWQHGKKMGRGRYDWKSGTFYDGQWLWGKRHGKGVISYSDGDRYDGEWKDDVKCGYGTYTGPTGDSYVGDWMNGKKNGIGTYTYPDGDRYEGEWKDGKKNGIGTYTYSDGDRYEGEWKDDEKCGHGRIIKSDGRIQQDGEWQHNKFIGIENRKTAVIGANDPCPCGSGKKFKKCHGNMEKRAEFSGDTVGEMDALHSTRRLDSIIDELDEYDVKLVSIPRDRMIAVMGVVRQLTGFGPADAKSLVNGLGVVKAGLSKSEADEVRRKLEAAGATVAVHLS